MTKPTHLSYQFLLLSGKDAQASTNKEEIADFLYIALGPYGDAKEDILKCLDYALSDNPDRGGFVLLAHRESQIKGAVVMNRTGMQGYIPENTLVYIAVDVTERGQGLGAELMKRSVAEAQGDVALHVEYDNPAKNLYERLGFKNKYAEMRFYKEQ